MSVRYQFYRPENGVTKKTTIDNVLDDNQPFGTADDVKSKLSACFPALQWRQVADLPGEPWFGESDDVIVQFGYERDGSIMHVLMHDGAVENVRKAAKGLQAAAVDAIEEKLVPW